MNEIVAGILILLSAFLSMAAGIGIVRFPDVLSRLHASTKPQILGVAAICVAIWLLNPSWGVASTLILVLGFQMMTQPMTAHMIGRAAYRTEYVRADLLIADEIADAVDAASAAEAADAADAAEAAEAAAESRSPDTPGGPANS
ncbi:multisubunit sodium/proton antiporter MrpG subunit [Microterricola gilva]|uniref:Multisubunit sodium/proton antiporter MrpG subunit n=1 Tax=Microterricola gilva TaxID=393267 RepID=A0A4Q8AP41_9MICO|nr:monovalent cation/H(+) antiporter subunit G [Microterricola gilva]RZU66387.1 multisubunit sodium/proton antiporter MrpG subunit [Microterricola gilva]